MNMQRRINILAILPEPVHLASSYVGSGGSIPAIRSVRQSRSGAYVLKNVTSEAEEPLALNQDEENGGRSNCGYLLPEGLGGAR
jgi:hypothetical protein